MTVLWRSRRERKLSDKKLVECRAERDKLKVKVAELYSILDVPEMSALKRLAFKNRALKDAAVTLRSKVSSLEQSNKDLLAQIEPLREAFRAEKRRTTELVQEQAGIVAWFNQHGHPLAPNEPILEKLDNLEAGLQSLRQLAKSADEYFIKYPELAKDDNCEKAIAYLRERPAVKCETCKHYESGDAQDFISPCARCIHNGLSKDWFQKGGEADGK